MTINYNILSSLNSGNAIYPETDLLAIDRPAFLLAFGCRYHAEISSIEFSIAEDLSASGVPDITANISYKKTIN